MIGIGTIASFIPWNIVKQVAPYVAIVGLGWLLVNSWSDYSELEAKHAREIAALELEKEIAQDTAEIAQANAEVAQQRAADFQAFIAELRNEDLPACDLSGPIDSFFDGLPDN